MALTRQQQRLFGKIVQHPGGYRVTDVDAQDVYALYAAGMVRFPTDGTTTATPAARLGYYIGQDDAFAEARGFKW